MTKRLPDFLGIGALKAGTTFLDRMLRSHPELNLPEHLKETEYFSRYYDRGARWYESLFDLSAGGQHGEVSPQYLADPRSIDRVKAANPNTRLIVSVRNPVDRAYSQYRHWVLETGYANDFATFINEHPGAVNSSFYGRLLRPWLDAFPRSSLRVIVFEEMIRDPIKTVQSVYAFLGVDPNHVPDASTEAANVSITPRHPTTYRLSKRVSRTLYAHRGEQVVSAAKSLGLARLLRRSSPGPNPLPTRPSETVRQQLADVYRDDAAELAELTRPDLLREWGITSRPAR
jgi:hypothetical protein